MKTKLPIRSFPDLVVVLALAVISFGWNLSDPGAQAQSPVPPQQGQAPPSAQPSQAPRPPDPTAAAMKGKTAGEFYKNVKVLKNIPAAEIHPAMEYITVALGVGCGYCHEVGHFDTDDKREKKTALNMIKMTFALDGTVFNGKREVTCYTCHRGAPKGAATLVFPGEKAPTEPSAAEIFPTIAVPNVVLDSSMAPVVAVPGPPAAPKPGEAKAAAPVSLPPVDEVFSRYSEALGGTVGIQKASTLVEKGKVEMLIPPPPPAPGKPPAAPTMGTVPAELDRKVPDRALLAVEFPTRQSLLGYDGATGWLTFPITREDTGGELALLQEWAEFIPALNFRQRHTRVQIDALEKIGDRDAFRVVGLRTDGSGVDRLYFDAQSGLLLRSWTTMNSVLGSFPEETNYEDYREVSGLKIPFVIHLLTPEGNRTYQWDHIEVNTPVEDVRFAKPEPPAPPPAPRPAN
jgi:photosynthetic reaction center cytochrome c subunit